VANVDQIEIRADINRITVELYKLRADRNTISADTPKLLERLLKLSKRLSAV
jgi:hypothetical protein